MIRLDSENGMTAQGGHPVLLFWLLMKGSMYVHFRNSHVNCQSDSRKAVAVYLAVYVKGIDIGHAAYVVQDRQYAVVDVGGVDVVLA